MSLIDALFAAKLASRPAAVLSALQGATAAQKQAARAAIAADAAPVTRTVATASATITAADRDVWTCSVPVSSLTVQESAGLVDGSFYEIIFVSGSAAPTITLPASVRMPDGFTFEAGTIYDLCVRSSTPGGLRLSLAAVGSWPAPEEEADG